MTAPISNGPTTTRLHHYAGHYSAPVGLNRWWVVHWRAYVCTREKVLPASLLDRESAKKFAPRAQNGPNSAFLCMLGELFRGRAAGGAVLGELFRANRYCGRALRATGVLQTGGRRGFCTTRSPLAACRRRVGPPCSAIPPDWRRRGRGLRCWGAQTADHLGEKH